MQNLDEPNLLRPLAQAFLRSLASHQRVRLKEILLGGHDITRNDVVAMPGLGALIDAQSDGALALQDGVGAILSDALVNETPCETGSRGFGENPFLAITKGAENAEAWVAGMPEAQVAEDLNLGLFKLVQALKSGDLARADALLAVLSEHFDIPTLEACGPPYPPELSCVLFMKAIYADKDISDAAAQKLFELLASVPKDASLLRAILYNVILDVELRQHNMDEAEGAAQRALFHYNAAGENGVTFYVHIYLAVIHLWAGDIVAARARVDDARTALAEFVGAVPNDELLLASFDMIVRYEAGDSAPFVKHLMRDDATIPFGELWPSIAHPIISYGRRALATQVTPSAALSWVRQWRLRQRRSQRFDALISAQEALALQDLGRWQEADELLADIAAPDERDVSLARLASGLDRAPKSPELAQRIGGLGDAADLSLRQVVALRLMAAQSALNRGMEREAARHLGAAVKLADPTTYPAIWHEARGHVSGMLSKRVLRTELTRFPKLQRQLRKLAKADGGQKPDDLTHQEYRILQLLAEAQSNKAIAVRLGIALPTVKFHVKNLCRKTSTHRRRDVVRVAIEAGWLGEI